VGGMNNLQILKFEDLEAIDIIDMVKASKNHALLLRDFSGIKDKAV
jgi:hypothetical protein